MAYTLNMTALMIFPRQDVEIYTLTTTTNESLIQWNYVTIPVPNRTLNCLIDFVITHCGLGGILLMILSLLVKVFHNPVHLLMMNSTLVLIM